MTDDRKHARMRMIRLRNRLDDLTLVVVVALLLLCGLGAWMVYGVHVDPATETDQRTVATWTEQATLTHAAEVREPNPVFPEGETLSDQPVYFTSLSPVVEGSYVYSYDASESGTVDVEMDARLRIRSVDDDTTLWETTEQLETVETEQIAPGETTELAVAVDVTEAVAEANRIEDGLGATVGTTEIEVAFEATAAGVVNGESVANVHRGSLSLEPGGETYGVTADDDVLETHETVETVESDREYGLLRSYGSLVVLGGALLGLVGFAGATYTGRISPSPAERAALDQYRQRREFDDWISTGQVPAHERAGTRIELDSLEDLVDTAIDMDRRVIEDRETGSFLILDDGRYYCYAPETATREAELDDIPNESGASNAPDGSGAPISDGGDGRTTGDDLETGRDVDGTASENATGSADDPDS